MFIGTVILIVLQVVEKSCKTKRTKKISYAHSRVNTTVWCGARGAGFFEAWAALAPPPPSPPSIGPKKARDPRPTEKRARRSRAPNWSGAAVAIGIASDIARPAAIAHEDRRRTLTRTHAPAPGSNSSSSSSNSGRASGVSRRPSSSSVGQSRAHAQNCGRCLARAATHRRRNERKGLSTPEPFFSRWTTRNSSGCRVNRNRSRALVFFYVRSSSTPRRHLVYPSRIYYLYFFYDKKKLTRFRRLLVYSY